MKDSRYSTIKVLIESGHIKTFLGIFDYIPKTTVYRDLRVNFKRFSKAIIDPSKLRIDELMALAEMFQIDAKLLIDMAYEQAVTERKRKLSRKKTS